MIRGDSGNTKARRREPGLELDRELAPELKLELELELELKAELELKPELKPKLKPKLEPDGDSVGDTKLTASGAAGGQEATMGEELESGMLTPGSTGFFWILRTCLISEYFKI